METPTALSPDIWERTPPEVQAYIRALELRLSALEARVQALQQENRALQERLKQNSRNSSRPPSAPMLDSAEAAGEMVEVYWQALTRDIPFLDYSHHPLTSPPCFPRPLRAREAPGFDWPLGHRAQRAQRLSIPAVNDGASRRFLVTVGLPSSL